IQTGGTDSIGDSNDWPLWIRHEGDAIDNECLVRIQHYSGPTYKPQPILAFLAGRGTVDSPIAVHAADPLGIIDGRGFDGSTNDYVFAGPAHFGWSDTSAQI